MSLKEADFHQEDKVRIRGSSETGMVTGFPTTDGSLIRVFWNSHSDMRHENVPTDMLEIVECKHKS